MTLEMILVFAVLIILIILFIGEWLPVDVIAIGAMVVLMVSGVISPQEGIMGFSNPATITILSLMFIAVGLEQSGAITTLAKLIRPLLRLRPSLMTSSVMSLSGLISAFISTTAVVLVFMKVLINSKDTLRLPLSKILIPLSYASILGGSCTLIGTSTNLIVNQTSKEYGIEAFSFFEFTSIGIVFFAVGLVYIVLVGRYFLPKFEPEKNLADEYGLEDYLVRVRINDSSKLIGQSVKDSVFKKTPDINVLEVKHKSRTPRFAEDSEVFRSGDELLLKTSLNRLKSIYSREGFSILSPSQAVEIEPQTERESKEETSIVEILVRPESQLIGSKVNFDTFKQDYSIIPLAIKKGRKLIQSDLEELNIEVGDMLLVQLRSSMVERLINSFDFIVINQFDDFTISRKKSTLALVIMLAVVLVATLGIAPIMVGAISGAFLMMILGCVDLHKAYRQIDWSIIFLLAGLIPLGTAMSNVGATTLLADTFVFATAGTSPTFIVGALFGITVLISGFVSNNATAVLLTPVAVGIAGQLSLEPKALILAVMFGANMSFFTPIGYQTNTLVFGAGGYRFKDFLIVGGFLTIIVCVLSTIVIPYFYFN